LKPERRASSGVTSASSMLVIDSTTISPSSIGYRPPTFTCGCVHMRTLHVISPLRTRSRRRFVKTIGRPPRYTAAGGRPWNFLETSRRMPPKMTAPRKPEKVLLLGYSSIARRRILPALRSVGCDEIDIATRSAPSVQWPGATPPRKFDDYEVALRE